jgi:hypothetical protein
MKPIKAAIAAFFISTAANAAEPDLQMDNGLDGHIYALHEPCDLKVSMPITHKLYRGVSISNEGKENEASVELCWFSPEVDMSLVPEEYQSRVVRVINILAPDGIVYTFNRNKFEPKGTQPPKEQEY